MERFLSGKKIVTAIQFTNKSKDRVYNSLRGNRYPKWDEGGNPALDITTPDGIKRVFIGDWVVDKGLGEYEVYKSEDFENTHKSLD